MATDNIGPSSADMIRRYVEYASQCRQCGMHEAAREWDVKAAVLREKENPPVKIARYSSVLNGPRWERLGPFIKKLSAVTGCKIISLLNDAGWIFETITFTVEGNEQQIKDFRDLLKKALEQ